MGNNTVLDVLRREGYEVEHAPAGRPINENLPVLIPVREQLGELRAAQGCLGARVGCVLSGSKGPSTDTKRPLGPQLSWQPLVAGTVSDLGWPAGHFGQ